MQIILNNVRKVRSNVENGKPELNLTFAMQMGKFSNTSLCRSFVCYTDIPLRCYNIRTAMEW